MTRRSLSLLIAAALASAALAACSRPPVDTAPAAAPAEAAKPAEPMPAAPAPSATAEDVHAFKIGQLSAFALKDGDIDVANDGKTFAVGRPPADVATLLSANGQPTDAVHLSIQPLLVRSGERVLLFDTGAGNASFARAGRLQASLRSAGVEPDQVTDIFISHAHPDHIGGLLSADGGLAFANAAVHLSAPEWASLQANKDNAKLAAALAPKVRAFAPNAELVPGTVKAVAVDGHTPGHSAYEIASGEERLLYIGDSAHSSIVSVQRPQWTIQFDGDAPKAEASRVALLKRIADGNLHVYAVHFPFPGLGRIKPQGEGFVWVPDA
ncbi:metallo-beta-lactamase superfamily protein [Lysobacter enzymogenes]|uniref:Metallo-beta-lactamase superfamily protein n=1 Tax=Lysobacter enzymogenes TaxID=69 RepID=A0A0S2DGN2_LYSEN|nr:MBL fold metallo-hydrolase [Lysobacter enzymogenes]ALN57772.1 metallo-beta-lactamase superfamily protein [Lysobacter enzymogenes]QCW26301.1 MBL fold metallo-hydrolase [Lysobacter enzymogenes]